MAEYDFKIDLQNFNEGFAPLAHVDSETFIGNQGMASELLADILSKPGFITQSPALADLTNGTQAGIVDELIRFILDKPTAADTTFGVGTAKLFKISSTAVNNSDIWPQAITNMTEGESITRVNDNLFIFYNTASAGDIAVLPLSNFYLYSKPQTAANDTTVGTVDWANPSYALGTDTNYATVDTGGSITSHYLKLTNFGFSIPTDATIVGLTVEVTQWADFGSGNCHSSSIKFVKAGVVGGSSIGTATNWGGTASIVTYGTANSLAGNTLTPADINDSGFGVAISVTGDGAIANVNNVTINVYYTRSGDAKVISAWGSQTDKALLNASHPSASKEDILVFGNGQYAGVYIEGLATLNTQKLDFGKGATVADVVFSAGVWWIAVNTGDGERTQGQIYMYDGAAISNILLDEAGIGVQKIGFLYVQNGIIYVCYEELTSGAYTIGYISGRQLKPLRYFTGSLPDHRQKTLYKNTILFASSGNIWSCGAVVSQLPIQVSKLAAGGYSTIGAVAAPFGTPLVASTDGSTNFRLAKFSGYSLSSLFKSPFMDVTHARDLGKITTVIVSTKALGANASCSLTLEGNQGAKSSSALTITGENKTRHVFTSIDLSAVEDIRVALDWSGGNATNDCPIRKITLLGSYVER